MRSAKILTEKTEFRVEVVQIGPIQKHPNADTLSLVDVDGYPVVIKTGSFREGDLAVYVPVDALVPVSRPEFAFLKTSRTDGMARVRAARLRGVFSMGLLVPGSGTVGQDVAEIMGVKKWLSPSEIRAAGHESRMVPGRTARLERVRLPVYGLDPLRKYVGILQEGEQVVVTEKIHGANARYCFTKGRLWVGSHRVMRGCSRSRVQEFFDRARLKVLTWLGRPHRAHTLAAVGDVWWEIAEQYGLKEKLAKHPDVVLYGEIYGEGVQDLVYDSPKGRKFVAFDAYDMKTGRFLDWANFKIFAEWHLRIPIVPVLDTCKWTSLRDLSWKAQADSAKSVLAPAQLAEGIVVKPTVERVDPRCGRVALKYAGAGYLLRKDEAS